MTPLFFDINAPEFVLLAVAAVILFGPERLPEFARKAAQVLHYVRQMAGNAQSQLKTELGPEFSDLDFRDLNPKQFVRKHLLEEVEPIITDIKDNISSMNGKEIFAELDSTFAEAKRARPATLTTAALVGAGSGGSVRVPWDPDAT